VNQDKIDRDRREANATWSAPEHKTETNADRKKETNMVRKSIHFDSLMQSPKFGCRDILTKRNIMITLTVCLCRRVAHDD